MITTGSQDESGNVAPARRRGLADEVADRIREAIFSGGLSPGTQLREMELSVALDVSRGPVREALMRLENEGLVHSAWHRGATVTSLTPEDVREIDSLRASLEDLAVRLVIERASEADLDVIEAAADAMSSAVDVHGMVRCDVAFHDAVFRAAGHGRLWQAWGAIRCQVQLLLVTRVGVSSVGYVEGVPVEHRGLVEVLRGRDVGGALGLFAEHRRRALEVVMGSV